MVQILPQVPSFNTLLAQTLGQTVGNIGSGAMKGVEQARDEKILSSLSDASSPLDVIQKIGSLSSEKQKNIIPMISNYLRGNAAIQSQQAKQQAKQQESTQLRTEVNSKLDTLESMIPYTGSEQAGNVLSIFGAEGGEAGTWGGLNREAVQKREEFDKLGFWVTDQIYTHFNKGTVSEAKLDQIRDKLAPNSELPERKNKGRIDALRSVIALPSNATDKEVDMAMERAERKQKVQEKKELPEKETIEQPSEKPQVELKPVKKGTKLKNDDPIAAEIWRQSGKNKQKAQEIAKKLGYVW